MLENIISRDRKPKFPPTKNPSTDKIYLQRFCADSPDYQERTHTVLSLLPTALNKSGQFSSQQISTIQKSLMKINLVDNMLLLPMFLSEDCNFTPQNFIFSFHGTKL
jgi:hypothetical protein